MIHHTETPLTKIKVVINDIERTCFDLDGNDLYDQYNKECHQIMDNKLRDEAIKNKIYINIFSYDKYITKLEKQKVGYFANKLYEKQHPYIYKEHNLIISLNEKSLSKLIVDLGI